MPSDGGAHYLGDRRFVDSHQRLVADVKARVEKFAMAEYDSLTSWSDDDLRRFLQRVLPIVEDGQRQVGDLTNAYLRAMARLAGEKATAEAEAVVWARKTDPAVAYARPVKAARKSYAQAVAVNGTATPEDVEVAKKAGADRLLNLIQTDLQLARTHTARATMDAMGASGYRRVLTGAENCALCVIASTQRYHRGDLMPIHHGCDCTVAPIFGAYDSGQVINPERYKALNDATKDQVGKPYYKLSKADLKRLKVQEHGEVGPVLTWSNHKFTGADDVVKKVATKKAAAAGAVPDTFEDFAQAETYIKTRWPKIETVDLSGVDAKMAREIVAGLDDFDVKFPGVFDTDVPVLKKIVAQNPAEIGRNVYARGGYQRVTLNRGYWGNPDKLEKSLASCQTPRGVGKARRVVKDNGFVEYVNDASAPFHPIGCTQPRSIVVHELGHLLDDALGSGWTRKQIRTPYVSGPITTWKAKRPPKTAQYAISEYAGKNPNERFAEALTSIFYTPSADRAKIVDELLDMGLIDFVKDAIARGVVWK